MRKVIIAAIVYPIVFLMASVDVEASKQNARTIEAATGQGH